MRILACRTGVYVFGLVAATVIGSCGGGSPSHPGSDGGAGRDDAAVACEQQQRDYVSRVVASDQQSDVAATVQAVISSPDFAQAMPYCSGSRPSAP